MIPTHNTIPYEVRPTVTYSLICLCVLVFVYQLTLSAAAEKSFLLNYAMVPARFTDGAWAAGNGLNRFDPAPFMTSMFLHGGFLHIASNLWTLWVFGPALEDRLGKARFLGLYLIAGLAAGLAHLIFNFTSTVPALGASGAIAGVIGAYVRRFPYAWINILQPVGLMPIFLFMPAVLFAGLWFMSQIVHATGSLFTPLIGGGVAWWAHIGGFLLGWWLQPRLSPASNVIEEGRTATQSAFWPLRELRRWMVWWGNRR